MNYLCSIALTFAGCLLISAKDYSDYELPKTWDKDFTISLSHTGSMSGSSSYVKFTYDSCVYIRNSGMEATKKSFCLLTEADRVEILKRMREFNVDRIRTEVNIAPVNDGWSTSICFTEHCISGGTSVTMSDQDKNQFSDAYSYLEEFAAQKAKKKKK